MAKTSVEETNLLSIFRNVNNGGCSLLRKLSDSAISSRNCLLGHKPKCLNCIFFVSSSNPHQRFKKELSVLTLGTNLGKLRFWVYCCCQMIVNSVQKETDIQNCDTLGPCQLLDVSVSLGLCPLRPEWPGRVGAKESEPAPAPSLAALALIEAKRFGLSRNFLVFLTLGTETQQQQEQLSRTILYITQLSSELVLG